MVAMDSLPLRRQLLDDARGLAGVHIAEYQGHRLRTFVLEGGVQALDVRLVQERELPVFQALGHLLQQAGGRSRAEGLLQHGAGVLQTALGDRLLGHAVLVELAEYVLGLLGVQHSKPRHLQGQGLQVGGVYVLVDKGCLIRSQGDNDGGSLLGAGQLRSHDISHCRPPLPSARS